MAAGTVVKISATEFELTQTLSVPGGVVTRTIPLTLAQARSRRANLAREQARVAAQLDAIAAKIADADAEIQDAIDQGVQE